MGTHTQRRAVPWWPLVAVAAALVAVAAVVTVQLRASAAEQRREAAAQVAREAAAEAAASQAAADHAAAVQAEQDRQSAVGDAALALSWRTAGEVATARLAEAEDLLGETEDQVNDEDVRTAVAEASDGVSTALEVEDPGHAEVVAVSAASATLQAALVALRSDHDDWLAAAAAAEAEAEAEAAEQRAAAQASARYDGDCGSGGSWEAPPEITDSTLWTSVPTVDGDGSNGNLPRSAMTALGWCVDRMGNAQWLRSDAAAAMVRLNEAFRAEFGENIAIDLSYRSYADQVLAREIYGGLAAAPGTSNHGWGTAIDTWEWEAYDFGTARHEWLVAHGPSYGWVPLSASQPNTSEYWHFDFVG